MSDLSPYGRGPAAQQAPPTPPVDAEPRGPSGPAGGRTKVVLVALVVVVVAIAAFALGQGKSKPSGVSEAAVASQGAGPQDPQKASVSSSDPPTAESLISQFKKAGIPIGKTLAYTEETDGNNLLGRPGQYYAKVNWVDERMKDGTGDFDTSDGGALEMFTSERDAKKRYEYLKTVTSSTPLFAEYDYLRDTVVLRLAIELTPTQAKVYESVVKDALR